MDWCESIRGLPQVESSKQLRREPGPRTRWANKRGHPRPGCLALASRRAHGAGTRSTGSRHLRLRHLRVCRSSGVSVSSAELELRARAPRPRRRGEQQQVTPRHAPVRDSRVRSRDRSAWLRPRVAREPGVLRSAGIHRFIDGSWNEIARHICTLKHTRLSAHTAPQEKAREVASHTARCPQYTSRVRRLRRQGSAAAPFCARAFPRRTVHMPRSLEPSQRHKPRPLFGPTAVRTIPLRWDADVRIAHTAHAPSSSHLCPHLRPASPRLGACHDRVRGAPTDVADRSPFAPLCLALARGLGHPHASTGASPEHRPHRCSQ